MSKEEMINNAIATFCAVPEAYQKIFKELGSDFSDEMVKSIKQAPVEEVTKMVQSDEQLFNSICTIYSKYADDINAVYEDSTKNQTALFAKGSKLEALFGEFSKTKKFGYGGGFYNNFTSGDIRKIQLFLAGHGYDVDIDGKMGPQTMNAIKQYQTKHKLTADGLWGYNTNAIHRVLMMDSKGSYKPTYKTEVGDQTAYSSVTKTIRDISPKDFQNMEVYYYSHPEEFFDQNNANSSRWRQILHNSGKDGEFYINRMYGLLSPEQRKQVATKTKTKEMVANDVADEARENREKAAVPILSAIAAPVMLGEALGVAGGGAALSAIGSMVGGIGGGWVGDKVGGWIGSKFGEKKAYKQDENGNYVTLEYDPNMDRYGVAGAIFDPNATIAKYKNVGSAIGGLVGTAAGSIAGNAALNGAKVKVDNIVNRGVATKGYRQPVTVNRSLSQFGGVSQNMPVRDHARNFVAGLEATPQVANSSAVRLGGPHGLTFNGRNPGSFVSPATVENANAFFNNSISPTNVRFGQQPNLGISSKIGNAYDLNWNGVARTAAQMYAPTLGMDYSIIK